MEEEISLTKPIVSPLGMALSAEKLNNLIAGTDYKQSAANGVVGPPHWRHVDFGFARLARNLVESGSKVVFEKSTQKFSLPSKKHAFEFEVNLARDVRRAISSFRSLVASVQHSDSSQLWMVRNSYLSTWC